MSTSRSQRTCREWTVRCRVRWGIPAVACLRCSVPAVPVDQRLLVERLCTSSARLLIYRLCTSWESELFGFSPAHIDVVSDEIGLHGVGSLVASPVVFVCRRRCSRPCILGARARSQVVIARYSLESVLPYRCRCGWKIFVFGCDAPMCLAARTLPLTGPVGTA